MVFFLEKSSIFLPPPLMVERNVLGSNLLSFLDAATSGMIDPLSRIPVAQKATSYDEGTINAQEGRKQRQLCGQICYSARQNNDFTLDIESQSFQFCFLPI